MLTRAETIRTERLTLRPFAESDRENALAIFSDPRVTRTYMIPDLTREQAYRLFERFLALSIDKSRFVYAVSLAGKLIGFLNDTGITGDTIELGYAYSPEYWGKGYATEALRSAIDELIRIGFTRIEAGYFSENPASERVMEKCGMLPIDKTEDIEYRGKTHHTLFRSLQKD